MIAESYGRNILSVVAQVVAVFFKTPFRISDEKLKFKHPINKALRIWYSKDANAMPHHNLKHQIFYPRVGAHLDRLRVRIPEIDHRQLISKSPYNRTRRNPFIFNFVLISFIEVVGLGRK